MSTKLETYLRRRAQNSFLHILSKELIQFPSITIAVQNTNVYEELYLFRGIDYNGGYIIITNAEP